MSEQRLIDIETKLAYQEAMIEELNRVISSQHLIIENLEKAVQILAKDSRLKTTPPTPKHQKPPHY